METRAVALGDGILAVGIRAVHPDFQSQQAASSGTDEAKDEDVFVSVFKLMPSIRCPGSPVHPSSVDASLEQTVADAERFSGADKCSLPFPMSIADAVKAVADPTDLDLTSGMPDGINGTLTARGAGAVASTRSRSMAWARVWHGTRIDAWPDAEPVRRSAGGSGFGASIAVREHLVAIGAPFANEVHFLRAAPHGALLQDGEPEAVVPD